MVSDRHHDGVQDTQMSFTYEYRRPSLTVDCVVFGLGEQVPPRLEVLLIERAEDPGKGQWALPGGFVRVEDTGDHGESLDAAALRQLQEKTGVTIDYLEQLYTFGAPDRDTRGRVITVAYYALIRSKEHEARAGQRASQAHWFPLIDRRGKRSAYEVLCDNEDTLVGDPSGRWGSMAFDHGTILKAALDRLQAKVRYAPIGFNLLPPKFTLGQLQSLYEAVLQRDLDKGNFRKKIRAQFMDKGLLVESGLEEETGRPGPAARLYRFDKRAYSSAVKQGFNFEI